MSEQVGLDRTYSRTSSAAVANAAGPAIRTTRMSKKGSIASDAQLMDPPALPVKPLSKTKKGTGQEPAKAASARSSDAVSTGSRPSRKSAISGASNAVETEGIHVKNARLLLEKYLARDEDRTPNSRIFWPKINAIELKRVEDASIHGYACIITLVDDDGRVEGCHIVQRSTLGTAMDLLEYHWGMVWMSFCVDMRRNIVFMDSGWHGMFDKIAKARFMLVPHGTIVKDIRAFQEAKKSPNSGLQPSILDAQVFPKQETYPYTLVCFDAHKSTIYREDPKTGLGIYSSPFTTFPILRLHILPIFAIWDCGRKLDVNPKPQKALDAGVVDNQVLEDIMVLYDAWSDPRAEPRKNMEFRATYTDLQRLWPDLDKEEEGEEDEDEDNDDDEYVPTKKKRKGPPSKTSRSSKHLKSSGGGSGGGGGTFFDEGDAEGHDGEDDEDEAGQSPTRGSRTGGRPMLGAGPSRHRAADHLPPPFDDHHSTVSSEEDAMPITPTDPISSWLQDMLVATSGESLAPDDPIPTPDASPNLCGTKRKFKAKLEKVDTQPVRTIDDMELDSRGRPKAKKWRVPSKAARAEKTEVVHCDIDEFTGDPRKLRKWMGDW